MPNDKLTEIAVILDRSGSMSTIKDAMISGFAEFVAEQRKIPDPCVVSLYQFDATHKTVFEERALGEVEALELIPGSTTALLDGMGISIARIGQRLAAKRDVDRPGKVIVLVITDGLENASREFSREKIADMVKHQSEAYNWQFAFLGANMDSFAEAGSMGISASAVMDYAANPRDVNVMYRSASRGVSNYRKASSPGASLNVSRVDDDPSPDDAA